MRSFIRKLAAGTLLCSMTFAQVPAWNVPKVQIKAEEVKAQETSAVRLTCRQAYVITLKKGWDAKDCTFKSEAESVVLVSKEGIMFGVSTGTTNVVVTHKTGDSFSCKVDVDAMEPPELKEEIILLARIYERVENVPYQEEGKTVKTATDISTTLFIEQGEEEVQLIPFVSGSKYTREDISYTVSDENIISIENDTVHRRAAGKLKAKKPGKVTVTAKCNGVKKTCVVTVKK